MSVIPPWDSPPRSTLVDLPAYEIVLCAQLHSKDDL